MATAITANKVGFLPREWCALTSISRAVLYALPEPLRPRSVKVGRRRIIIEAPAEYLARMAETAPQKKA